MLPRQPVQSIPDRPRKPQAWRIVPFLWVVAIHAHAQENVALGAVYTLAPAPGYAHCTDSGDMAQLTDGAYVSGYFWTQPGTVGWQNAKPVVITIDLGQVKPIRGVALNTAAGTAGVAWPVSIGIYVADEPGAFHRAGDLVTLGAAAGLPAAEGYAVYRYATEALQCHGRYVALAIVNQPFVFTDEVEVFAGDPAWLAQPLPGGAVADVREGVAQLTGEAYIRRRLTRDLEAIRSAMAVAEIESAAKETLSAQAGALAQEVATSTPEYSPEMRAILPLNPLHERVLALQAALWRAQGQSPVTLWQSGLWDALPFLGAPPKEAAPALDVHCMQGEYRAASFNISNATEGPLDVSVQVEGLPGGPNPGYVRVHEVVWTDTNAGVPVAAALPEAPRGNGSYRIPVAAGITRQVWLTLCPPDVTAGTYEGSIHVMAPGLEARLPLRLHVYPIKFPPKPRLHFGGWDYTDVMSQYEVTPENRAALIALLREYFVDTPWATAASMPWGKYDAAGNMTEEPDTTLFDAWMDAWVDADQYRVFVAVSPGTLPFEPGSDAFEQAVRDWCVFWARQIRVANANNSRRFGLLLLDEPSKLEDQMLVTAWARAVRRSASDLRVWEDPVFRSATEADRSMLESCDILCPNRQIFLAADMEYRKLFVEDRAKDTALEFYSCSGPVRTLDPYSYHRLQAWDCWRYGATAEYFWAFGDSGGAYSWNEYAAQRSAYTPLFIDKTAVTPGKHLEACREGIEDYETLAMLDDALEAARESQGDPAWIAAAEEFLKTMPTRVCDEGYLPSMQWSDPLDRTLADQVRIQALELLAQRAK